MLNPKDTNRKFYHNADLGNYKSKSEYFKVEPSEANLVSSLCDDGFHRPVLDLDLPAEIFQSSTPGHCHLYIDKPMTWDQYSYLLHALATVGILEPKYVEHSLERKKTMLRLPHIRKEIP